MQLNIEVFLLMKQHIISLNYIASYIFGRQYKFHEAWNILGLHFGFNFQSLLDLALRSTAAAADPLHEDVACSVVGNNIVLKKKKIS